MRINGNSSIEISLACWIYSGSMQLVSEVDLYILITALGITVYNIYM